MNSHFLRGGQRLQRVFSSMSSCCASISSVLPLQVPSVRLHRTLLTLVFLLKLLLPLSLFPAVGTLTLSHHTCLVHCCHNKNCSSLVSILCFANRLILKTNKQ